MWKIVVGIASLTLMVVGVGLLGFFFLGQRSDDIATNSNDPGGFNVPEIGTSQETQSEAAEGPEDKTLKVTIPKMARVDNAAFPDTFGDDEESLKNFAGIHLEGTGFPWQEEANVYLAGHRLGYPGYPSFLAFYDLDNLENGDEIFVEDSEGKKYTYRVFRSLVVEPTDLFVTEPMPGKNIVTLQSCTLPDYAQRLVAQAELVSAA